MKNNPEEYYNAYLSKAEKSHEDVKNKMKACFNELKQKSKHKYELETEIRFCCQKELTEFHNTWFSTSVRELKEHPSYFYKLGYDTWLLYVDLITYSKKLSEDFYNEDG